MRIIIFLCLLTSIGHGLLGQDNEQIFSTEDDLSFYADIMINGVEAQTRLRAANKFDEIFETYFYGSEAFVREENFHKFISILDAPNQSFRLISWLVRGENEEYDFRSYIIKSNGERIKFNRTSAINEDFAYSTNSDQDWYGCLYYRIMESKSKDSYLLFGYDPNGLYDNKKVLDVLTFDGKGVVLGKPIFEDKESRDTYLNRLVLSFSSDASVNFNYDSGLKTIIHDHLEHIMGLQPGQGPTYIPDGTYEGYVFKKGKWKYKEKIFDHIYEAPPRPKPVFQEKADSKKG